MSHGLRTLADLPARSALGNNVPRKGTRCKKGFTLVEVAIVLVIVGLLLGGVLKGQEMINSAKVRNAINATDAVSVALNIYTERYHSLPGDNRTADIQRRGGVWATLQGGPGIGRLGEGGDPFVASGTALFFWQHLRAAGFITGAPTLGGPEALPHNAWGGAMGVTSSVLGMGNVVCLQNVPGSAALALDRQRDDGNPSTGSVRALGAANAPSPTLTATAPGETQYDESLVYTVCHAL